MHSLAKPILLLSTLFLARLVPAHAQNPLPCEPSPESPAFWQGASVSHVGSWNFNCLNRPVVVADLGEIPKSRSYAFHRWYVWFDSDPQPFSTAPMRVLVDGKTWFGNLHEWSYMYLPSGKHFEIHYDGATQQRMDGLYAMLDADENELSQSGGTWIMHVNPGTVDHNFNRIRIASFDEPQLMRVCLTRIGTQTDRRVVQFHKGQNEEPVRQSDGSIALFGSGSCLDVYSDGLSVGVASGTRFERQVRFQGQFKFNLPNHPRTEQTNSQQRELD